MKCSIEIIQGSLAGRSFPLVPASALSLGRSRSCTVHFVEPDVSGRHVTLTMGQSGGNVMMEVISSRVTLVNGTPARMGDQLELDNGTIVQLGGNVRFKIVKTSVEKPAAEEKGTLSSLSGEARTEIPVPIPVPPSSPQPSPTPTPSDGGTVIADGDETKAAAQTRMASPEEIEALKQLYQRQRRRRMVLWVVGTLAFLVIASFLYVRRGPKGEVPFHAPQRPMKERALPYMVLTLPDFPRDAIKRSEGWDYTIIDTNLDRQRDVPLRVYVETFISKDELTRSHKAAFESMRERYACKREKDKELAGEGTKSADYKKTLGLDFEGKENFSFQGRREGGDFAGPGVPVTWQTYTRTVSAEESKADGLWASGEELFGFFIFFRFSENAHVIRLEIRKNDRMQGDGESFLRRNLFYHAKDDGTPLYSIISFVNRDKYYKSLDTPESMLEWWEGTEGYDWDTAYEAYCKMDTKKSLEQPVEWGQIYYRTISALIKAQKEGDDDMKNQCLDLLRRLREKQDKKFLDLQHDYRAARRMGDRQGKERMEEIQRKAEAVFSDEFRWNDYRYDLIRRKDW
ncbi:MAG: FHA domain-containing protein [Victivallales bacterium]|nr:FHA domain-containing protein [Victivallales bacterium]